MRKMKFLSLVICLMLVVSVFAGCGAATPTEAPKAAETKAPEAAKAAETKAPAKEVKITMLNSKGEIQAQLEDAAKEFNKQYPNITLEVIPCPAGGSPFEKISSLYASNNAPALSILDGGDLPKLKDKSVDLSGEKWVKDTPFIGDCTIDGKIISFPFVVEGCGLIYNKAVLDKAKVDPASIKTQKDLENALKAIEATGVAGDVICKEDWSLGNHFSVIPYANKSKNTADVIKVLNDLKAGKLDLTADKGFNGLVATFDILKKYNKANKAPLDADYNKSNEFIAKGQVGFLFQGNWAWPEFVKFKADPNNFGYIPVPISDDASDIANSGIQAGPTKFVIVDKEQNDADKQAAAKSFLNWLVYDKAGQEAIVTKAQCISPFKNVTLSPENPLGKGISSFIQQGNTLVFTGNLCPSDHWKVLGASWQKYLAGKEDKAALAKDIMAYWKAVK